MVPTRPFGVLSIAIAPAFQRQGVGELLMAEVELRAKLNGYKSMILTVHPENIKAVNFYQKIGWVKRESSTGWNGRMIKNIE